MHVFYFALLCLCDGRIACLLIYNQADRPNPEAGVVVVLLLLLLLLLLTLLLLYFKVSLWPSCCMLHQLEWIRDCCGPSAS